MTKNIFILNNWASYYSLLSPPGNGYSYSFLLHANDDIKSSYRQISTFKIPFTLTLNIEAAISDDLVYQVISFLFLPHYQNRVIFILTDQIAVFEMVQNHLQKFCALQSLEIEIFHVNNADLNAGELQIKKQDSFFICEQIEDVQQLVKENEIDDTNDSDRNEIELLRNKNVTQRKEIELLTAELEVQKAYNEKLRTGHQAKEIQSYYDREYEILPGWYKKIGGLIKWMMKKK